MKAFRLMIVLALIAVGLINKRHSKHETKPDRHDPVPVSTTRTAVDQEIVKNAERLAETLRHCKESAQKNKQIN